MPEQSQNFQWDEFGNTFGNTVQDIIGGFGDTTSANAASSLAVANVNQAKADAIRTTAASNAQLMKYVGIAILVLVVGLVVVPLLKPILSKIKL